MHDEGGSLLTHTPSPGASSEPFLGLGCGHRGTLRGHLLGDQPVAWRQGRVGSTQAQPLPVPGLWPLIMLL